VPRDLLCFLPVCSRRLIVELSAQSDGTDLDPHNLKWQPRGEGGGGRGAAPAQVAVVEDGAPRELRRGALVCSPLCGSAALKERCRGVRLACYLLECMARSRQIGCRSGFMCVHEACSNFRELECHMLQLCAEVASWRGAKTLRAGAGGKVDWGHLGADVKRYGDGGKSYKMVGDEIDALPAPPPPPAAAGPGPGSAAALNGADAPAGARAPRPSCAGRARLPGHICSRGEGGTGADGGCNSAEAVPPGEDGLRVRHVFMPAWPHSTQHRAWTQFRRR